MTVANFSHERLVMVHFTARQIRAVTEQAFIWAHLRKVFGKPLIEQPVIRAKFGEMFAKCDAVQAQLEFISQSPPRFCTNTFADSLFQRIKWIS